MNETSVSVQVADHPSSNGWYVGFPIIACVFTPCDFIDGKVVAPIPDIMTSTELGIEHASPVYFVPADKMLIYILKSDKQAIAYSMGPRVR